MSLLSLSVSRCRHALFLVTLVKYNNVHKMYTILKPASPHIQCLQVELTLLLVQRITAIKIVILALEWKIQGQNELLASQPTNQFHTEKFCHSNCYFDCASYESFLVSYFSFSSESNREFNVFNFSLSLMSFCLFRHSIISKRFFFSS